MGPLIGSPTWGGLIGLSGTPALVDGGTLTTPTFRFLTTEGEWAIENEGVAPDIPVDDRPDALAKGQDPSLDKGIRCCSRSCRRTRRRRVIPPIPVGGAPR